METLSLEVSEISMWLKGNMALPCVLLSDHKTLPPIHFLKLKTIGGGVIFIFLASVGNFSAAEPNNPYSNFAGQI